jgi:uncharacterized protein
MSASSVGELSLTHLLQSMTPKVHPTIYVFATVPLDYPSLQTFIPAADMLCREDEGWTVILPQTMADELKIAYIFACKKVTLNIHSSLEAVGFLAAVTSRLARNLDIGVNPVSGYYNNHLFVAVDKAEAVAREIEDMAADAREEAML